MAVFTPETFHVTLSKTGLAGSMDDMDTTTSDEPDNTYTVVFRSDTVVDSRLVMAPSIRKAAKIAERMTAGGGDFPGWTVYSITLGVTS